MLSYLQKKKRLQEALALIKRSKNISESQKLDFFKAHKKIFPEEAAKCFSRVIDRNLQSTGDHYYEAVADAIRHLSAANRTLADNYIRDIRTNYKRRRNLIALLDSL
jgi:hypothetical protein